MSKKVEFVSFKKLLIFGTKGSGKTSLANTFQTNKLLDENEPSNNSKK